MSSSRRIASMVGRDSYYALCNSVAIYLCATIVLMLRVIVDYHASLLNSGRCLRRVMGRCASKTLASAPPRHDELNHNWALPTIIANC